MRMPGDGGDELVTGDPSRLEVPLSHDEGGARCGAANGQLTIFPAFFLTALNTVHEPFTSATLHVERQD
jgi:hypothetical protein